MKSRPMTTPLVLVSYALCPYVQRAAIVMIEKGIPFQRTDIDLAHKPDWFLAISPTGKTPLLRVGETSIFESSVICEYLEDIAGPRLHPTDPIDRARHRAWMEYASTTLNAIAALYNAHDEPALRAKAQLLRGHFERIEQALGAGPYFEGATFSMVDAAFAPVLRYFEVIDVDDTLGLFHGLRRLGAWRKTLAQRPSVQQAVAADYHQRLHAFLLARDSALGDRMREDAAVVA
jgi:glutathione S-transferase